MARNTLLSRTRVVIALTCGGILGASGGSVALQEESGGLPKPEQTEVTDPLFREPYIDLEEWREAPVRHRYVHGGFKGTQTRFSLYLAPKAQYEGRFFQHITPFPDNESLDRSTRVGGPRPAPPVTKQPFW